MKRSFTAADSAAIKAVVYARADVREALARRDATRRDWSGPAPWARPAPKGYEREFREILRDAYREALEAAGWCRQTPPGAE